jgi:molybdopterin molybdotransferase
MIAFDEVQRKLIAFDEAQRRIIAACAPLPTELVALDAARGRVLATDLTSSEDLVPFPRSAMDGFAVLAEDTEGAPLELALAAVAIAAGSSQRERHLRLGATPIATGAPLPPGADAVIPFERVTRTHRAIRILAPVHPGEHVFPPGDDARAGDLLAPAGTLLGPALLALLASAGFTEVRVTRTPRVAIVCTGDELVAPGLTPGYGQIRNSNVALLSAALADLGATVALCETVADERAPLARQLEAALKTADLVITTGGASVGARDFVKPVLRELGVRFLFDSVAMRPARPSAFGVRNACAVAVLPGNPAAVFVALHEFVRPAVFALAGRTPTRLPRVTATLDGRLHARGERTYLPFVRVRNVAGMLRAEPLENQCSALTRTAAESNAFAVMHPGAAEAREGDSIEVDVFDWSGV